MYADKERVRYFDHNYNIDLKEGYNNKYEIIKNIRQVYNIDRMWIPMDSWDVLSDFLEKLIYIEVWKKN